VDTVVDHTAVVDIAAGHTVVVVVDIAAGRKVAVAVGIAAGCTVAAVNSRVAHTGMDMAVVVDTVEKIVQVAHSPFEQAVLEGLSQAECHNWNRNARQVRPAVHN